MGRNRETHRVPTAADRESNKERSRTMQLVRWQRWQAGSPVTRSNRSPKADRACAMRWTNIEHEPWSNAALTPYERVCQSRRVRREDVSHLSHFPRSHLPAKISTKKKEKKRGRAASARLDFSGTAGIHQKIGKEAIEELSAALLSLRIIAMIVG